MRISFVFAVAILSFGLSQGKAPADPPKNFDLKAKAQFSDTGVNKTIELYKLVKPIPAEDKLRIPELRLSITDFKITLYGSPTGSRMRFEGFYHNHNRTTAGTKHGIGWSFQTSNGGAWGRINNDKAGGYLFRIPANKGGTVSVDLPLSTDYGPKFRFQVDPSVEEASQEIVLPVTTVYAPRGLHRVFRASK